MRENIFILRVWYDVTLLHLWCATGEDGDTTLQQVQLQRSLPVKAVREVRVAHLVSYPRLVW